MNTVLQKQFEGNKDNAGKINSYKNNSNPQIRKHSKTVLGTFWNTNVENEEPNEDRSQDDPHPEVGHSVYQSRHSNDSDPDEAPHNNILKSLHISFRSLLHFPINKNEKRKHDATVDWRNVIIHNYRFIKNLTETLAKNRD